MFELIALAGLTIAAFSAGPVVGLLWLILLVLAYS